MNPINPHINQVFSDDMHKFVFQDHQPIKVVECQISPKKKFMLNESKKDKKSSKRNNSPWMPIAPEEEAGD